MKLSKCSSPCTSPQASLARSMKSSPYVILMVSIVIDKAYAFVATTEVLPEDALVMDDMALQGTNAALNRPCHPRPWCTALLDSNKGTAVYLQTAQPPSFGVPGSRWHRATKLIESPSAVRIFLQRRVPVSNIIVICSASHSDTFLHGSLVVTIKSHLRMGNGTDENFVMNDGSRQMSKDIAIRPSNQSELMKVSFRVEDEASAVSIEWRSLDPDGTINNTLRISEVMVITNSKSRQPLDNALADVQMKENVMSSFAMGQDVLPIPMDEPEIMRIKDRAWAKHGLDKHNNSRMKLTAAEPNSSDTVKNADLSSANDIHDLISEDERPIGTFNNESRRDRIFGPKVSWRGKHGHRTTWAPKHKSATTLAPAGVTVGAGMAVDARLFTELAQMPFMPPRVDADNVPRERDVELLNAQTSRALGLPVHIPTLLALILVGALAAFHVKIINCHYCCKRSSHLPQVDDPEAALGRNDERPRWEFFNERAESLRCSRRLRFQNFLQTTRSPPQTESEPEEETEPLIQAEAPEQVAFESPSVRSKTLGSNNREPSAETPGSRRVVLLYASPLCYINQGQRPTPLPQIPFEREWEILLRARDEANAVLRISDQNASVKRRPGAALEAQPLTATSLRRLVSPCPEPTRAGAAAVLHLSAHGIQDNLVAENGKTTAHFLSQDALRSMLGDGSHGSPAPAKLVVLNACSLRSFGDQFVQSGVPHVICSSAELRDSASRVFLSALYSSLFQGGTVAHAFSEALVALRVDPEASTQSAADFFHLLPEQASHDEVMFRPEVCTPSSVPTPSAVPSASGEPLEPPTGIVRDSSGASSNPSKSSSSSFSNSFLSTDNAESSTDGPDESCGSEGHADTSSTNGNREGNHEGASTDSDGSGSATENTRLLSSAVSRSTSNTDLDNAPLPSSIARRSRIFSNGSRGQGSPRVAMPRPRVGRKSLGCTRRPVSNRLDLTTPYKLPPRRASASANPAPLLETLSPFGRALPPLPEDFLGRAVDVWEVMQHLCERRAVVVCGAPDTMHGIGKSAVLDSVHRAFSLQMGGVCVAVHLKALSDADAASVASSIGWIDQVRGKLLLALEEYQELWCQGEGISQRSMGTGFAHRPHSGNLVSNVLCTGSALRRRRACHRSVSRGFHPLSDPIAIEAALEELVALMIAFADCCEERSRAWPASIGSSGKGPPGVRILLLLDECDHLIQQRHFQDALANVLRRCAAYSVVLSTQQQMVETGGGWFKVIHKAVAGLTPKHAAQLFLRRAHRPLYWDELIHSSTSESAETTSCSASAAQSSASAARAQVIMTRDNEADVLARVASHPLVAAQRGNPRRLIALASKVHCNLPNLSDLQVSAMEWS